MEAVELPKGTIIQNRYEVCEQIGSGGMGVVYKVLDRSLQDSVLALKVLHPHLVNDQASFSRFRNEVLLARTLRHENIVGLYDFGEFENKLWFISMEYVDGDNLGNLIYDRGYVLSFFNTLILLCQVAQGISHAHQMGIIHRDLKPDNILLSRSGIVKITDFGLARTLNKAQNITLTGETVGTPHYMSPEQIQGHVVDGRSDIYALGILAYELSTGTRPFEGSVYFDVAKQHLNSPLPSEPIRQAKLPIWFQEFLIKCTEKDREKRYKHVDELIFFLQKHLYTVAPEQESSNDFPYPLLSPAMKKAVGFTSPYAHLGESALSEEALKNQGKKKQKNASEKNNGDRQSRFTGRSSPFSIKTLLVAILAMGMVATIAVVSVSNTEKIAEVNQEGPVITKGPTKIEMLAPPRANWQGMVLKSLELIIQNTGKHAAKDVRVKVKLPNEDTKDFYGPELLLPKNTETLSLPFDTLLPKGDIKVKVSCDNCPN